MSTELLLILAGLALWLAVLLFAMCLFIAAKRDEQIAERIRDVSR